jgi:hypothetical protein
MDGVNARVSSVLVAVSMCSALACGCHESDLEPQSPLKGDWTMAKWDAPAAAMPVMVPSLYAGDPAPIMVRPRSISLGYIGDGPLTPSPYMGPRWPYVGEGFYGGYGYANPYRYRRGFRARRY